MRKILVERGAATKGAIVTIGGKRDAHGGRFLEPTGSGHATPRCLSRVRNLRADDGARSAFPPERRSSPWRALSTSVSAAISARDLTRVFRLAGALEVGPVGVGDAVISNEIAAFKGVTQNGMCCEGSAYEGEDYVI